MVIDDLSELKPGQKVRATSEGTVVRVSSDDNVLVIALGGDMQRWITVNKPGTTIELLEPEYVHFGVYQDANGSTWFFDQHYFGPECAAWFAPGSGVAYEMDAPRRPLTRLVPEADSAA